MKAGCVERWVPLGLALVFVAVMAYRPVVDADAGFHLAVGEWVWEHRAVPAEDPLVAEGERKEYVHFGWLYQVAVRGLYGACGYRGLTWLHAGAVMGAFVLAARALVAGGVSPAAAGFWLALGAVMCERRFLARPEVFSWVLLMVALRIGASGKRRAVLTGTLFALWANVHGMFAVGWLALGFATLDACRAGRLRAGDGWARVGAAVFGAGLSPMGWKAWALPLEVAFRQGDAGVAGFVAELRSPWGLHADGGWLWAGPLLSQAYYAYLPAVLVMAVVTWRRRGWGELLALGAGAAMSCAAMRMIPFFVLWSLPLAGAMAREISAGKRVPQTVRRCGAGALCTVLAALCCRVVTGAHYTFGGMPSMFGAGLALQDGGDGAGRFLREHLPGGARLMNDFNSGSWLAWTSGHPVWLHGNLEILGAGALAEYKAALEPDGFRALLARRAPDAVAFSHGASPMWFAVLRREAGWRCVYFDLTHAVFFREGLRPEVGAFDWGMLSPRALGYEPLPAAEQYLALLAERAGFWRRFWVRQPFAPGRSIADLAMLDGEYAVAEQLYVGLLRARACNVNTLAVVGNLGACYDALGDAPKALMCYGRLAAVPGGNARAEAIIDAIEANLRSRAGR